MLRLDFTAAPRWIDMADGVRVLVQPFSSSIFARAQTIMRRDATPLPDDQDEAVQENFQRFTAAIAAAAVTDWDGVGDVDGNVLPVSQDAVQALMSIPRFSEAFKTGYMVGVGDILAEKKGYAPSLNGSSGADLTIAVAAPVRANAARPQ